MTDDQNRISSVENSDEGAATDQPEVEGHRHHATENPDERAAFATDQPEVEGHRISVSPASENPDERAAFATDQPEVEGHRFHAMEDEPDERVHERAQ